MHGTPGEPLKLAQTGFEQPWVPAELIDDPSCDQCLVGRVEQGQGAKQRGEHPAPVDVADDQHRQVRGPRQPHVRDVGVPQVDLRG